MSAPRTNLEQQKRRHWAPLVGMAAVTFFALGLIVYWLFEEAASTEHPRNDGPPAGETRPGEAPSPPANP